MAHTHQFERLSLPQRLPVHFTLDGQELSAFAGDTVLTAVLSSRGTLRPFEFGIDERAGFCLMGACQDCWVYDAGGKRLRACSTPITEGLTVVTSAQGAGDEK